MAELYLDVHLELDPLELSILANPVQAIAEMSRQKAEEMCLLRGAVLRHPEPAEAYSRHGVEFKTGRSVLLVATRWIVDGRP